MTEHKPGCDALGGYGHGIGPCTCGGQAGGVLTPVATLPIFIRRRIEQAIHDSAHPKGMSINDGRVTVLGADLNYMLRLIDRFTRPTPAAAAPTWFVLVPKRLTRAMTEVINEDNWDWADLLAAAEAITEDEYNELSDAASPAAAAGVPTGWKLIDPQGRERCHERTQIRAWARLSGYKPTVENLLAAEEKGWRVLPASSPVAPVGAPTEERSANLADLDAVIERWQGLHDTVESFSDDPDKDRSEFAVTLKHLRAFRALLSRQGCELATDATKQQMFNGLTQEETDATASVMGLVHLAATPIDQDFRRRPASSEAAPSGEGSAWNGEMLRLIADYADVWRDYHQREAKWDQVEALKKALLSHLALRAAPNVPKVGGAA